MTLNLTRAHSTRIHRQDLIVEARESALMLDHDFRLEAAVPIPRHVNLYLTEIALQSLRARAVPRIRSTLAGCPMLLIAQVMRHLGAHRALDQFLGQALHQPVRAD